MAVDTGSTASLPRIESGTHCSRTRSGARPTPTLPELGGVDLRGPCSDGGDVAEALRLDDELAREAQIATLAIGAPVGIHDPLHVDVVREPERSPDHGRPGEAQHIAEQTA